MEKSQIIHSRTGVSFASVLSVYIWDGQFHGEPDGQLPVYARPFGCYLPYESGRAYTGAAERCYGASAEHRLGCTAPASRRRCDGGIFNKVNNRATAIYLIAEKSTQNASCAI